MVMSIEQSVGSPAFLSAHRGARDGKGATRACRGQLLRNYGYRFCERVVASNAYKVLWGAVGWCGMEVSGRALVPCQTPQFTKRGRKRKSLERCCGSRTRIESIFDIRHACVREMKGAAVVRTSTGRASEAYSLLISRLPPCFRHGIHEYHHLESTAHCLRYRLAPSSRHFCAPPCPPPCLCPFRHLGPSIQV